MTFLTTQDTENAALRRRVRLFLWGAAVFAALAVIAIYSRQGLLTQTIPLYFVADSAVDITKGTAVKVAGFRIGSVTGLELQPDARVKVRMDIDRDYMAFITHDALAQAQREGLVGTSVIEIIPGEKKNRIAAPNDIIQFERTPGLGNIAQQLHKQVEPILDDVKQLTALLAAPDTGLKQTLQQVNHTVETLHSASDELKTLLRHGDQQVVAIGSKVVATLEKTEGHLETLGRSLHTVETALPGIVRKVDGVLDDARKVSGAAASEVPGVLKDSAAVAEDAREIVSGAKKSWPIRNFVTPPGADPLPPDSYAAPAEKTDKAP